MNINDLDPDNSTYLNIKTFNQYLEANPELKSITMSRMVKNGIATLRHCIEEPEDRETNWDNPYIQLNYSVTKGSRFTELPLILQHTNTSFIAFQSIMFANLTDHIAYIYESDKDKDSYWVYLKEDSEEFKKLTPNRQQKIKEKLFKKYENPKRKPTFTLPLFLVLKDTKGEQRRAGGSLIINFLPLFIDEANNGAFYPLILGLDITTGYKPAYWSDEDKKGLWEYIDKKFKDISPQESFEFLDKLEEPEVKPVKKDEKYYGFSIHALKQVFGDQKQLHQFSDTVIKEFQRSYSKDPDSNLNKIKGFGVSLTDIQLRVVEGILKAFSDTNYKGNMPPRTLEDLKQDFVNIPAKPYRNIKEIPIIRVTRSDIVRLSSMDVNQRGDVQRVIEVIEDFIPRSQYCFYWLQLAYDDNGKPVKDSQGNWEKEAVSMIDSLFKIKVVRHPETNLFKHYEIAPTAVFLDQRENYCIFVPYNWREEVKRLVGEKKASRYTFLFLLFLRYQYEEIRRYNKYHKDKKPYEINWSYEETAEALKMPTSVYKRKKDRAYKILDDAYFTAKALNYLKDNKRENGREILILNPEGYYNPQEKTKELTTNP